MWCDVPEKLHLNTYLKGKIEHGQKAKLQKRKCILNGVSGSVVGRTPSLTSEPSPPRRVSILEKELVPVFKCVESV